MNSAGIAPYRPLGAIDTDHVRDVLDANVLGAVLLTQAVVPYLPSPGGRIIHFSSRLAVSPIATSSVYAAAKAAVSTLTLAFSKELGPKGITINAVAPGVIETDMTTAIIDERGDAIKNATPLGRIGVPDDIAGIVALSCLAGVGLDHRTDDPGGWRHDITSRGEQASTTPRASTSDGANAPCNDQPDANERWSLCLPSPGASSDCSQRRS